MMLFYSELSAVAALLACMLAVNASPQYHPWIKADLMPKMAYGGMGVMLIIAVIAFISSGGGGGR